MTVAFLAGDGPRHRFGSGLAIGPRNVPPSSSQLCWGYDEALHGALVVDDATVFGCVDPDDVVVILVLQPGPARRFAALPVAGALGLDHVRRHPQRDPPIDRSPVSGDLRAGVLDDDAIAEEPRRLGAGVADQ